MSTAAKNLAELFQCSELAAGEICKEGLALALCFAKIYDAYDLDHVLSAKRAVRKVLHSYEPSKGVQGRGNVQGGKQKLERIRLSYRSLSRPSTLLFDHTKAALEAKEKFHTALGMAHCQKHLGLEKMLSETLSALDAANQLSEPLKVSEGRLAYESIRRDYYLLECLGIGKNY